MDNPITYIILLVLMIAAAAYVVRQFMLSYHYFNRSSRSVSGCYNTNWR